MTLASGTKLGPYEILAPIGAGGMGEVYRARDPRVGRDVAIKVSAEQFSERFEREIHAVASLNHSNICTLYDVGPNYLVMELVEGPTLADRIKQGAIPLDESLEIARQIADALEAAHEKGIVHRDLKPANIKIKPDGTVKVLDFGLAKVEEATAVSLETSPTLSVAQTAAGVLLGTAAYMPPDQARGKVVDKRADIWAFGVVLYEMLTGKQLFAGETVSDTLAAVLTKEPEWEKIPPKARPLLRRCLERDPKRRLRDIGDFYALLENTPESMPAKRPWLAWSVAATLTIVAAVAVWAPWRKTPAVPVPVRFEIPLPEKTSLSLTGMFQLSPDGRWLAFYAIGIDGGTRIWVRSLDSLEARPLAGTEISGETPFFWSPDSRFIAFGTSGVLKKIDVSGGPAQTLCNVGTLVVGGSWNRDGTIIFGTESGGLMKVSSAGGVPSSLTRIDPSRSESYHAMPIFLPDGRHFLYKRNFRNLGKTGIFAGSLDAKPEEQDSRLLLTTTSGAAFVPASDSGPGQLLFMREGVLLSQPFDDKNISLAGEPVPVAEQIGSFIDAGYFSVSSNSTLIYRTGGGVQNLQLTWLDRAGKILGPAGEPGLCLSVALSPDGRRAAVTRPSPQGTNIWLLDFANKSLTSFTFGQNGSEDPVWSTDGRQIIFCSLRDGNYNLYWKPANGEKDEELLFRSHEDKTPTSCSRDGRYLLYTARDQKTKNDLWILPLKGDRKPIPFLRTEFDERDGNFSSDTRWIAYVSNESVSDEVYVRAFAPGSTAAFSESGAKWMVSMGGGTAPRWREDGKELFYLAPDGRVMSVDVTVDTAFHGGAPKPLLQPPRKDFNSAWNVAADGKRFLFMVPKELGTPTPFTVVLNWQAESKK